jgi:hypothetical protein
MIKLILRGLLEAFITFFMVTIVILEGSNWFHLIDVSFKNAIQMSLIGGVVFSILFILLIVLIAEIESKNEFFK